MAYRAHRPIAADGVDDMAWLVTGGAGYIGSHVVRAFRDAGHRRRRRRRPLERPRGVRAGGRAVLPRARILDGDLLRRHLRRARRSPASCTSPASSTPGVSVQRPLHTYEQNVTGTAVLLAAMQDAGVDAIVFSSSAAVYGTPDTDLVTEDTPKNPESPYGESKLIGEWLLRDQGVAAGLAHTSLRYFNVVGSGYAGPLRHEPAQPLPAGLRRAARRPRPRASTATTTRRPTAPACATTSTSPTWRRRTSPRRSGSTPASRSSPSTTSAAATASRSARS